MVKKISLTNKKLHNELVIKWVHKIIQDYAIKDEKRLVVNELLDGSEDVRRLKWTKPYKLVKCVMC